MDKNRGRKGVLAGAAELFDLPADVVAGLPHVEVVGNREYYMKNHRGIPSCGGEETAVKAEKAVVRIHGRGLELVSMTGEALRVRGTIERVEWVE